MAAQNRTVLKANLAALAAVLTETGFKAWADEILDSAKLSRDVQKTVNITGAGTTNVDFSGYDTVKVSTGYDCTLNIQNIVDGDVKFLWLSKNSGVTVEFTGATSQEIDTDYTEDLTTIVYTVTKKYYGTVLLVPLTKTFDFSALTTDITALETRIGTLNVAVVDIGNWDMDGNSSTTILHGLTMSKIRSWQVRIGNDDQSIFNDILVGGYATVYASTIVITRTDAGIFDNTSYNDAGINRGTITIWYVD